MLFATSGSVGSVPKASSLGVSGFRANGLIAQSFPEFQIKAARTVHRFRPAAGPKGEARSGK
ncbi:hypothetical protein BURKHO8Y_210392 [Burkholderia sp. 8Y]|nr:hypothetical protein BURKHO8Y_210392 [Burkholderia sp. 8Y]